MSNVRAVLLDVFDTVLTVDFDAALAGLAAASGLTNSDWAAGGRAHGQGIMTGVLTPYEAFSATFRLAGNRLAMSSRLSRETLSYFASTPLCIPMCFPSWTRCVGAGWRSRS